MTGFFVKDTDGRQYTPIVSTSGEALAIATNKYLGTPHRKRAFKGHRAIWDGMKMNGFSLGKYEPSNASGKPTTEAAKPL